MGTQAVQAGNVINLFTTYNYIFIILYEIIIIINITWCTGILMGLGDQIAQNFIENRTKPIDYVRTMQFAGIGLLISVII